MQYRTRAAAILPPIVVCLLTTSAAFGQTGSDEADPEVESIVVIGTQDAAPEELDEITLIPGGVTLVDMSDFRDQSVSSLADVLRYVPGVWSTSDSGNDSIFLSSRGSNLDSTDYDMNGIKLLQDGLPVTSADGSNHNRVVDPLSAQHATVARGANALQYGASTLGGSISFVSPTARDSATALTTINAGSHGQLLGRMMLSEAFNERLDGLLMLEGKQWDGYRGHNRQDRKSFYGNFGWRISGNVVMRLYATVLENDQELPGSLSRTQVDADPEQANASAERGNYQIDVDAWRAAGRTVWQIDPDRRLEIGFSLEEQSLFHPIVDQVMVDFDGPGPAEPVEVFSLLIDTDQRDVATAFRYEHGVGQHDFLVGFNYAENRLEGGNYRNLGGMPNGLTSFIDNSADLLEAFAMDRWHMNDRDTLIVGVQTVSAKRDVRTTDADTGSAQSPSGDYSSVNPRIGLIRDLREGFSVYASLSRLFEPPTNYELEDNVAGGATLDPMEGAVLEVGTRGQLDFGEAGFLGWDVAVYFAGIENEILSVDDPAAPGTSLTTNVDETVHAGIEGSLHSRLALGSSGERFLEPRISVTVNDFHFDGDPVYGDNRLPAAPRYALAGELIYRGASGFYAGPTLELAGERYADFANSYTVDSYALLGLRAGFTGERWSFYADVRNVLNEDYIANFSVRNVAAPDDAILNPGIPLSAYIGLEYRVE